MTVNWTHWLTGCKQLLAIRSSTGCNIVLVSFIVTHICTMSSTCMCYDQKNKIYTTYTYACWRGCQDGMAGAADIIHRIPAHVEQLFRIAAHNGFSRSATTHTKSTKRISCINRAFLGVNDIWRGGLTRFVTYYFVFLETLYTVTHRFRENI